MKQRLKKTLIILLVCSCSLGFTSNAMAAMTFPQFINFMTKEIFHVLGFVGEILEHVAETSIDTIKLIERILDPDLGYQGKQQAFQNKSVSAGKAANTHASNSSSAIFNAQHNADSDYKQTTQLASLDTQHATFSTQTQGHVYKGKQAAAAQTASEIGSGQYTSLIKLKPQRQTLATVSYEADRKSQLALGSSSATANTNMVSNRNDQGGEDSAKSTGVWADANNISSTGMSFLQPLTAIFQTFEGIFSASIGAVSGLVKTNGLVTHINGTTSNTNTLAAKFHHNIQGRQYTVIAENSGNEQQANKKTSS